MHKTPLILWALLCVVLLQFGCKPPPGRVATQDGLSASQQKQASGLYARFREEIAQSKWRDARVTGKEILQKYPKSRFEEDVLYLSSHASSRLRETQVTQQLLERLVGEYPATRHRGDAWEALSNIYNTRGRWAKETEALIEMHGAIDDAAEKEEIRIRLRILLEEELSLAELELLARKFPQSIVGSTVCFLVARGHYQEDGEAELVGPLLEEFLQKYPQSRYVDEARMMLGNLAQQQGYRSSPELSVAIADRIGVLCPLTGEYAALGQAMYDGALLALEEYQRLTGRNLSLVSMDTRGDEVVAVHAARRLIDQDGVIAVIGGLLSSSTVAVATLCQERGVPLISPTATKESISTLGDYVFQTNLTHNLELSLLAEIAVNRLLRNRFAILYPAGEEGEAEAGLFRIEVESRGAEIVSVASYDRGVTDFSMALRQLRKTSPEVLFIPASPSEMRLIAPQLTFHNIQAQLLGPGSWNNSLLARELGDSMDRAVFPSDIALIPENERSNFETLWRRRFPQSASNAFGLKTYFAARKLILALEEGASTRTQMQAALRETLLMGGEQDLEDGLAKLRILEAGKIISFPIAYYPGMPEEAVVLEASELEDAFNGEGF